MEFNSLEWVLHSIKRQTYSLVKKHNNKGKYYIYKGMTICRHKNQAWKISGQKLRRDKGSQWKPWLEMRESDKTPVRTHCVENKSHSA